MRGAELWRHVLSSQDLSDEAELQKIEHLLLQVRGASQQSEKRHVLARRGSGSHDNARLANG
jgi:hypothetical protein